MLKIGVAPIDKEMRCWHDARLPDGMLLQKYGCRVVYDATSHLEAKLASVLHNKIWTWRPGRSDHLVNIQSKLPLIDFKEEDKALWPASHKFDCVKVCIEIYILLKAEA